MRAFVNSDHAEDYVTRRSRTSFIVFLNVAPIVVYSKKKGAARHLVLVMSLQQWNVVANIFEAFDVRFAYLDF